MSELGAWVVVHHSLGRQLPPRRLQLQQLQQRLANLEQQKAINLMNLVIRQSYLLGNLGHEKSLPKTVDNERHLAGSLGHQIPLDVGQHQEQHLRLRGGQRLKPANSPQI